MTEVTLTHPHVRVELSLLHTPPEQVLSQVSLAIRQQVGPQAARDFRDEALSLCCYDEIMRLILCTVEVV